VLLVINVPEPDMQTRIEIAEGRRPRRDFYELQRVLDADLLFLDAAETSRFARVTRRLIGARIAGRLALAQMAFRRRGDYDIVFTDTDAVGLPFALFLKLSRTSSRSLRHVTLSHNLTSSRNRRAARGKRALFRSGIRSHIDTMIVHSSAQLALAVETFGMPAERVIRLPYHVDTAFWQPTQAIKPDPGNPSTILIPGHECRDYPTMLTALRDLSVDAQITTRAITPEQRDMASRPEWPANLVFHEYDYLALRDLYSRSSFVVVPLLPVDFQAGITVLLEAMAMGKAVVVTGVRGQTDVINDPRGDVRRAVDRETWPGFLDEGEIDTTLRSSPTGFYVRPEDPGELRAKIEELLADEEQASLLGRNGRDVAQAMFSIEAFAARFATAILGGESGPHPAEAPLRQTASASNA
jgi:glycosyltransferase involved in cell wall biosynthesis